MPRATEPHAGLAVLALGERNAAIAARDAALAELAAASATQLTREDQLLTRLIGSDSAFAAVAGESAAERAQPFALLVQEADQVPRLCARNADAGECRDALSRVEASSGAFLSDAVWLAESYHDLCAAGRQTLLALLAAPQDDQPRIRNLFDTIYEHTRPCRAGQRPPADSIANGLDGPGT